MQGYVVNIEEAAVQNIYFRRVLYTATKSQLVVMSLLPGEEIGEETHPTIDQFFRIEEGVGISVINTEYHYLEPGTGIVVPAGASHNIINTGTDPLKLYSIYSPPNHADGTVHRTIKEASNSPEFFDGITTAQNQTLALIA